MYREIALMMRSARWPTAMVGSVMAPIANHPVQITLSARLEKRVSTAAAPRGAEMMTWNRMTCATMLEVSFLTGADTSPENKVSLRARETPIGTLSKHHPKA
jgi:hypothetical protein